MKIEELKEMLENRKKVKLPIIFIYKGSGRLVCEQYIDEICSIYNKPKRYIDHLQTLSMFESVDNIDIQIYVTDELKEIPEDNTIVLCKKSNIKEVDSVNFDELENWQVMGYMKGVCTGLKEQQVEWVVNTCKDKNRLFNDIDKLRLFTPTNQPLVFDELFNDGYWEDLTNLNIFNLTNAIQKRDYKTIGEILSNIKNIDIEPTGLLTILYNNFKDMIEVKMGVNASFSKEKKYKAVKYNSQFWSRTQLVKCFDFLTLIDYKLKQGEIPHDNLVDYIITNILTF